jgi:hypothetical protein
LKAGEKIVVDDSGNVYVSGSIIISPADNSDRERYIFLSKHDVEGDQIWIKRMSLEKYEVLRNLLLDEQGYLYLLSDSYYSLDAKSTAYLRKLSHDGEEIWLKSFEDAEGRALHVDATGIIIVVNRNLENPVEELAVITFDKEGQELSSISFEPGIQNVQNSSYVAIDGRDPEKLRLVLTKDWAYVTDPYNSLVQRSYLGVFEKWDISDTHSIFRFNWGRESLSFGITNALIIDDIGNIYITGDSEASIGYKEYELESGTTYDAFLTIYNVWEEKRLTTQFGAKLGYTGIAITTDSKGNVIVGGSGKGTVGGEPLGKSDAFIKKYSPQGVSQWADNLGTEEFDAALDVTTDAHGFIYVTGYFYQTWQDIERNEYRDKNAGKLFFLAKYEQQSINSGHLVWLKTFENAP